MCPRCPLRCRRRGVVQCTQIGCISKRDTSGCVDFQGNRRSEGAHWMKDCNMCWCRGGLAHCTRRGCFPQPPTVSSNDTKHLNDSSSTQAVTAVMQAVTAADTMSTPPPSRITGDED